MTDKELLTTDDAARDTATLIVFGTGDELVCVDDTCVPPEAAERAGERSE